MQFKSTPNTSNTFNLSYGGKQTGGSNPGKTHQTAINQDLTSLDQNPQISGMQKKLDNLLNEGTLDQNDATSGQSGIDSMNPLNYDDPE